MCEQHKKKKNNLEDWCKENGREDILKEWDTEKNRELLGLEIEEVSKGSDRKVWWLCSEGHSYEQVIYSKTNGNGCPYCVGKKALKDYNDLATTHPEFLKEWDTKKNRELLGLEIEEVTAGSHKKVWWLCEQGHSYGQQIQKKSNGQGCPYCSGQKVLKGYNDLKTTHPKLLVEWDYSRNKIKPEEVTAGSNKKVWWLCSEGHSYEQRISSKTNGQGCPVCSNKKVLKGFNDLATTHPEFLKEWDTKKNRELFGLEIEEVTAGSEKRVWWKCKEGHSYEQQINDKTKGIGCPVCSNKKVLKGYNDLTTTNPELVEEWDYSRNKIKPEDITAGTNKKVHWVCKKNKNHKWEAQVNSRTGKNKTGCPYCSNRGTSFPEQYLYYVLKSKFKEVSNREIIEGLEYDIFIKDIKLLIEYDGVYYHRVLTNGKEKEVKKEKRAKELDYAFIRVKESNKVKEIEMKDNIIRYKNRSNTEDLNTIIDLIIDYINSKYSLDISKGIPEDAEQKARELAAKEQYENSLEVTHPELCKEWDYNKNKGLKPSQVTAGSHKKVWWLCKERHSYKQTIKDKTKGSGCPYCKNKKVLKGYNDLATTNPEILKYWDYTKNKIKPEEVNKGSKKIVFWKCLDNPEHSYQKTVQLMVRSQSCPICREEKRN